MKPGSSPARAEALPGAQGTADWLTIWIALFAGVAVAMQVGKASIALPLLREDVGLGLPAASLYLSGISLGAALLGAFVGVLTSRFGSARSGMLGLAITAVAALASALAVSAPMLMSARLVEAVGLPLVVAGMPSLIQQSSDGRARVLALGLWSTWLPLGIAVAMLVSILAVDAIGWRGVYLIAALAPVLACGALVAVAGTGPPRQPATIPSLSAPRREILLMAAVFGLFSAIYLSVAGFLPSVAIEAANLSTERAAILALAAALLIVPGNIGASLLLARGVAARKLLTISFVGMAILGAAFLAGYLPPAQRFAAGLLFSLFAGMAPGVLWSLIPDISASTGQPPALVSGVFYQAAGFGQLAGPVAAGSAVAFAGNWGAAAAIICLCSILALTLLAARPSGG